MEKIREKNTAWYETIRSFFKTENPENEVDTGYEKWKRENADIINPKAIANLEKMLEHKDKKRRKNSKSVVENQKVDTNVQLEINNQQSNDLGERGE